MVLPKIHSPQDLDYMTRTFYQVSNMRERPLRIISSVESAKGLWNLGGIAGWTSEYGAMLGGTLSALLVCLHLACLVLHHSSTCSLLLRIVLNLSHLHESVKC